ncbi:MAG: hypothetical protein U9O95_08155 [Candidatus Marinimicrobia bacterium]|nr:hypothetical protein [Candidatus Neomarinimicrobiota bacterium]
MGAIEEEIMGYKLERVNLKNEYGEHVHFVLTGKRGAKYDLCENGKQLYFVRNGEGNVVGLKGNYTFSTSRKYIDIVGAGCFIPEGKN